MVLISWYRKVLAFSGMTLMGIIMYLIRYGTLGKGIELNRRVIAPVFCKTILLLAGVKVHNKIEPKSEAVIYFFNHNSFLDIFIVPLLGLKNTRFIISEATKKIFPLHLCNLGIDVLYIPTKEDRERRVQFFKDVTKRLNNKEFSVICSPEGQHEFKHWIAPFNKGVFHMATLSQRPIYNLFFEIPKDANPLESINMKSCTVTIRSKEVIQTEEWKEENLHIYIQDTRDKFLGYYQDYHGGLDDSFAR